MSTLPKASTPKTPRTRPEEDAYRYGWRYVRSTGPDGSVSFDQVPLSLEEVLHPELGDFIVQTDAHDDERAYLKGVFRAQLHHDPMAAVLSDCGIDWNIPGLKPLCPDVAVFFGVRRHIDWSIFNVREEGAVPKLVVEITSPNTRVNDVVTKVDYYHRARVPLYVIADVFEEDEQHRAVELIAYSHARARYKRLKPDRRGMIWLEPVRLWLGLTRDRLGGFTRLACFDPETGEELGDYAAIRQELAQARARAEAAEARIRELEAELKRSRRRKR